jgi:ABC-type dipeptide/oligopeptide/nickel transport system permease subunit
MLTDERCNAERRDARGGTGCAIIEWNWLGTDDQGRDVLARLIYGFRISVLFGLILTSISSVVGVFAGAVQGYFGGWTDLIFQRFIEIWTRSRALSADHHRLDHHAELLGAARHLLLFSWVALVGVVRAEFLRARNFEYVRAARALGCRTRKIMFKHVLPNAMVATLTFLPFILNGSITTLTSLDFLGFGLPPGSPSLGELLAQGKANLQAPWLGLTGFFVIALMLSAADLHRRGGARRLRSAQDVPPLLSIRDLSVAFRQGGQETLAVDRVSFDIGKGETVALVGESGIGQVGDGAVGGEAPELPLRHHPSGEILFKGKDLIGADEKEMMQGARQRHHHGLPGADDLAQPAAHHLPADRRDPAHPQGVGEKQARERTLECSNSSASARRRAGSTPSAPALGRPAPARDDRHGARQRARPADRRRADDGARRHRAGADPRTARRSQEAARHGDAVHHPRSRHRAQGRRPGLRHAKGKIVEAGPVAEVFGNPQHEYTQRLLAPSRGGGPTRSPAGAPVVVEAGPIKVWFPIKRGFLGRTVGHVKAVDGVSVRCARARPSASSANPAPARPRSASPCCG